MNTEKKEIEHKEMEREYELIDLINNDECYNLMTFDNKDSIEEYIHNNNIYRSLTNCRFFKENNKRFKQYNIEDGDSYNVGDVIYTYKYADEFCFQTYRGLDLYYEIVRTTDKMIFIRQLDVKPLINFLEYENYIKSSRRDERFFCVVKLGVYKNNKIHRRLKHKSWTALRTDSMCINRYNDLYDIDI
jgi:hypothetical protein